MATTIAASAALGALPTSPFDLEAVWSPREMARMAAILEGRHGVRAAEVADFFATVHGEAGDAGRLWAWAGVAEFIRQRERRRLNEVA